MSGLTAKQAQLLAFLKECAAKDFTPSYQEMADGVGLKSKHGVARLVMALDERGYIERMKKRARSIRVLAVPEPLRARAALAPSSPMPPPAPSPALSPFIEGQATEGQADGPIEGPVNRPANNQAAPQQAAPQQTIPQQATPQPCSDALNAYADEALAHALRQRGYHVELSPQ